MPHILQKALNRIFLPCAAKETIQDDRRAYIWGIEGQFVVQATLSAAGPHWE